MSKTAFSKNSLQLDWCSLLLLLPAMSVLWVKVDSYPGLTSCCKYLSLIRAAIGCI